MNNESEQNNQAPQPTPAVPVTPVPVTAGPAGPTNGLAIAALIVGIVAFLSGWIPFWGFIVGVAAVVLGILAIKKPGGKGLAIAGLVTGGLGALTGLVFVVMFIIGIVAAGSIATEANKVVESAQQSINDADKEAQAVLDAKKDFAKGETAKFDNLEVKINSVQRNYTPASSYMAAEDGKEYVVLNVTVKNVGDESEYVSDYDFTVSDKGLAVSSAYLTLDNEFDSGDLSPNGTITGNIGYEVTKGASDLKLQHKKTVYVFSTGKSEEIIYTLAF